MIQVLVVAPPLPDAPPLAEDLDAAGFSICARCTCTEMVREAVRHAPDVVLVWEPQPDESLFQSLQWLAAAAPLPVLVFTSDVRAESMERSLAVGVDAWEVNGYAASRLRALLQYTLARSRHTRRLQDERQTLQRRFEERKLVDRAKGILMASRQVGEEEAFRLLRSASMHAKQRIGQVSQQVIDAAQYAEAINRAGRLRMLSQRIVKLYALLVAGVEQAASRALLADSRQQGEAIFLALDKGLSRPTFGDLLDAAAGSWSALRGLLDAPVLADTLAQVHRLAEALLTQAERLTAAVAAAGHGPGLQVINVAGRQRMLAQRCAQQVLLGQLLPGPAPGWEEAAQDFERGLAYLNGLPLSTPAIGDDLVAAQLAWDRLRDGAARADQIDGRVTLAGASEELLERFDRLTGAYERSMQLLTG